MITDKFLHAFAEFRIFHSLRYLLCNFVLILGHKSSTPSYKYPAKYLKLSIIILLALFVIAPANAATTNVSILYGWNGTNYVPVQVTSEGAIKTDINLTQAVGLSPKVNNTYDLGSISKLWANLYARTIRSGGFLSIIGDTNVTGTFYAAGIVANLENSTGLTNVSLLYGVNESATTQPLALKVDANGALKMAISGGTGVGWSRSGGNIYPITLTDKVGIGTSSPSQKLEVASGNVNISSGNLWITGALEVNGSSVTASASSDNTTLGNRIGTQETKQTADNTTLTALLGQKLNLTGGTLSGLLSITGNPSNTGNLSLSVNSTLYVNQSTSNVGIGTTAPASKLSVSGTISAGSYAGTAAPTNGMIISGSVGIGTSSPDRALYVYSDGTDAVLRVGGNSAPSIRLTNSDATYSTAFALATAANHFSTPSAAGDLVILQGTAGKSIILSNQGTSSLVLNSSGNVGIGTTGPGAKLHVNYGNTIATVAETFRLEVTGNVGTDRGPLLTFYAPNESGTSRLVAGISGAQFPVSSNQGGALLLYTNTIGGSSLVERMRIDNLGNVGIGTTGPAGIFHVTSAVDTGILVLGDDTGLTTNTQRGLTVRTHSGGNVFLDIKTFSGGTINFRTGEGTETGSARTWMTVDPTAGNVGIGTTGPIAPLEVKYTDTGSNMGFNVQGSVGYGIYVSDSNTLNFNYGLNSDNQGWINYAGYANGLTQFRDTIIANGKGSAVLMVDGSSGNVGIGTTAPGAKLEVSGGNAIISSAVSTFLRIKTTADTYSPYLHFEGYNRHWYQGALDVGADANYAISLSADLSSALMTIQPSGNVGIGTTGPPLKLTVDGIVNNLPPTSGTTQTGGLSLRGAAPASNTMMNFGIVGASPWGGWIQVSDASDLSINYPLRLNPNGGNVGIGTTGPGSRLEVENTASADDVLLLEDSSGLCEAQPTTTGLTWSCSSDIRLKSNIRNASSKLGYVLGLPLFDYNVIKTGENATGPIAQETLKKYPELVREGDDGYLIVSEIPQPVIIKAIQELKAEKDSEIMKLKEENGRLRTDMVFLRQEIEILKKAANGGK